MLKIQRSSNGGVVFTLIGRIEMEHVAELQRLLNMEVDHHTTLDLKEVTRVDRDAVKFLAQCETESIRLDNCPAYLRAWIDRDKKNE
jgi:anti-anti-sigma regulatory factor